MTYTVEIKYTNGKVLQKNFNGSKGLSNAREYLNTKRNEAKPLEITKGKIKQAYPLYIF